MSRADLTMMHAPAWRASDASRSGAAASCSASSEAASAASPAGSAACVTAGRSVDVADAKPNWRASVGAAYVSSTDVVPSTVAVPHSAGPAGNGGVGGGGGASALQRTSTLPVKRTRKATLCGPSSGSASAPRSACA